MFGTIPTTIPDTTPVITPPATQTDTPVIPIETPIIAPTIPPSPDYTPASPDYSPASDSESDPSEDPSSDHIPPLLAILPFLSSNDDTTDNDTPDTPPSPTHGTHDDCEEEGWTATHSSSCYHSSPYLSGTSAGTSCKRLRSPMTSVPALSPVSGALSPVRADLIPSPKRVKDRYSGKCREQDIGPRFKAEIDECIAYADALRDRGIDARVVVEALIEIRTETGVRGPDDSKQGHRIVGVESAVIALTERIAELERDNRRLRDTVSVESQRVDRLQRGMSRMQRELRQMRRLRFYDRVRVGRLEACARKHMGYRP
ncbi:hypothetical protein Tco_0407435 [Tanacetum coccineum]